MNDLFLTNYTEISFLDKIKDSLRKCETFSFSVSFIKKAGLTLFTREMEEALERGVKGKIITSTYQNFTDIESIKSFFALQNRCENFQCHLALFFHFFRNFSKNSCINARLAPSQQPAVIFGPDEQGR